MSGGAEGKVGGDEGGKFGGGGGGLLGLEGAAAVDGGCAGGGGERGEVGDFFEKEFLAFGAVHVEKRQSGTADGTEAVHQRFAGRIIRGAADDDLQRGVVEKFRGPEEANEG